MRARSNMSTSHLSPLRSSATCAYFIPSLAFARIALANAADLAHDDVLLLDTILKTKGLTSKCFTVRSSSHKYPFPCSRIQALAKDHFHVWVQFSDKIAQAHKDAPLHAPRRTHLFHPNMKPRLGVRASRVVAHVHTRPPLKFLAMLSSVLQFESLNKVYSSRCSLALENDLCIAPAF